MHPFDTARAARPALEALPPWVREESAAAIGRARFVLGLPEDLGEVVGTPEWDAAIGDYLTGLRLEPKEAALVNAAIHLRAALALASAEIQV